MPSWYNIIVYHIFDVTAGEQTKRIKDLGKMGRSDLHPARVFLLAPKASCFDWHDMCTIRCEE